MKPIDIFGFIERYAFSIVVCALFIFSMIAPLALLAEHPNYAVAGKLKIDPVIPSIITKSEDPSIINYFHDYTRTQVQRMQGDSVMETAIDKMSPEEQAAFFPSFLDMTGRINMLRGRVQIKPVSRTHLIELSLVGGNQLGLDSALNSVMDSFLEKLNDEHEQKYLSRLVFLRDKKDKIEMEVTELETKISEVTKNVHSSAFVEDYNMLQKRVEQLQKVYVQLKGERIQVESTYNQALKEGEDLSELSLAPMIDEVVLGDQSLDFTTSWTYKQLQELRASIDGITKDNKDRQYVEKRMVAMKEYEAKLSEEVRLNAEKILTGKRDYEINKNIIQRRATFLSAKEAEESMEREIDINRAMANVVSLGILKGSSLQKLLFYKYDFLFRLDTRVHELEAESKAPSRITIEARAKFPKDPSGTNLQKLLMACVAAAVALPTGAFLLLELLDNRIHRPKDIEFAVGSPPLWPISKAPAGVQFLDVLTEAPDHPSSKAIRSLAVHLSREHQNHQAKTFLFSGVTQNVGTCSILLNAAYAIRNQVERVLVIDGDYTNNHFSKLLHLPKDRSGLGEFLTGTESLENCLFRDEKHGLDIIASGRPINASQASSRKFLTLVAEVQDMYDVIFLHTDPILTSDLTEYLCGIADVSVL
ncbi:MAG: hypothetical protein ABFR63_11670, partial [Thermodesulfobacteriota bacterium]